MLREKEVERLVFQKPTLPGVARFTQDSPILPDVWLEYAEPFLTGDGREPQADKPVDLLLNPYRGSSASALYAYLNGALKAHKPALPRADAAPSSALSYNESFVVVRLWFDELIRVALPLTRWWKHYAWGQKGLPEISDDALVHLLRGEKDATAPGPKPRKGKPPAKVSAIRSDLLWLIQVAGRLAWEREAVRDAKTREMDPVLGSVQAFKRLVRGIADTYEAPPLLWSVSRNRLVRLALRRSVAATKADAAHRLFDLKSDGIRWAVIDSGIDAQHPAFRRRVPEAADGQAYGKPFEPVGRSRKYLNRTRIVATYDFTRLRQVLQPDVEVDKPGSESAEWLGRLDDEEQDRVMDFQRGLQSGRTMDWLAVEPLLRVPHVPKEYAAPGDTHGTHVAGIIAADWRPTDKPPSPRERPLCGMCPDLELYDLRVLDDQGYGSEDAVLAALQFVRWLNANKDQPVVHGVNISLALFHDVANFACGRTPICDECQRLVGSGVVVVAAAGNEGYVEIHTAQGLAAGYQSISITDPGNADSVITVGATHRSEPHTYGVSYFSSRGPTGDGRGKPDLVAPGEKITSCVLGDGIEEMDGTSMAAPHVSGGAALLLSRHRELMGQPARVKEILCQTATDLGRERFFQGHGMLDVLRAIQSV